MSSFRWLQDRQRHILTRAPVCLDRKHGGERGKRGKEGRLDGGGLHDTFLGEREEGREKHLVLHYMMLMVILMAMSPLRVV